MTYVCPAGHQVTAPTPIDVCPAHVRGKPCGGRLTPQTRRRPKPTPEPT